MGHSTPLSLLLAFTLLLAQPATAWKTGYHAQICESALLQAENTKMEKEPFLAGCKAPDLERESYPPHHLTKNLSRMENYFLLSKADFEKGDYEKSSFNAGVVAHYIADLASPAHNGAAPACHNWIEDTRPEIYLVGAERRTIELKNLLESTANHSKKYAQDMGVYCSRNNTHARDAAMETFASYSAFNIALMLDSVMDYAPPQKTGMDAYVLTDIPLERAERKSRVFLLLPFFFAAVVLLLKRKR